MIIKHGTQAFDILQFCCTADAEDNKGVAPKYHRNFNPKASRALATLIRHGLVIFDLRGWAVSTDAGEAAYDQAWQDWDEDQE